MLCSFHILLEIKKKMFFSASLSFTRFPLIDIIEGISKGVGFVRFDRKSEAEDAIEKLNGKIPTGCTEPITVKFANSPAANAQKAQLQVVCHSIFEDFGNLFLLKIFSSVEQELCFRSSSPKCFRLHKSIFQAS